MRKKFSNKFSWIYILSFIVLFLYTLSMAAVLFWALSSSLKSISEFRRNILGLPNNITFENYPYIVENLFVFAKSSGRRIYIEEQLLYTVIYVFGTSFLATAIPCLTSYLTSKFKCFFSTVIDVTVMVTMILPIVGAYPSEIRMLTALGLYDTFFGVFLMKANFLGIYFLVFSAVWKGLPKELSEAAYMDGASETRVMFSVMIPVIRGTFFTVMLLKFVEFWNDYQMPYLYMPSKPTLSYGLYYLSNSPDNTLNYVPVRMAGVIMILMPILILFIIFKNRIMNNVTMGAVKG